MTNNCKIWWLRFSPRTTLQKVNNRLMPYTFIVKDFNLCTCHHWLSASFWYIRAIPTLILHSFYFFYCRLGIS